MAVDVIFYSLALKPAAGGSKTYAAAAAGKVSRGRKWYRLECRPGDVFVFPDSTDEFAVLEWLENHADMARSKAAFTINGVFHYVNDTAHDSTQASEHAVAMHEKGRPGWVAFVPDAVMEGQE